MGDMRIVVVGNSSAVAERGWTVVALEADVASARERVAAGEADGVASLDDSGWRLLALPPDGTQAARVKSALAERDRRGQRIGRPARRPPRALVQRCFDVYDEQGSYERAARALEAAGETTPTGAAWYPVTVKRILEASAAETRRILRRVGHILAEVDASGTVTDAELRALGDEHEFHPERLRATPPGPYTPPLVRTEGRYALSDAGLGAPRRLALLRAPRRSRGATPARRLGGRGSRAVRAALPEARGRGRRCP